MCPPAGCQCSCHNPMLGMHVAHLVACCIKSMPLENLTNITQGLSMMSNVHDVNASL